MPEIQRQCVPMSQSLSPQEDKGLFPLMLSTVGLRRQNAKHKLVSMRLPQTAFNIISLVLISFPLEALTPFSCSLETKIVTQREHNNTTQ